MRFGLSLCLTLMIGLTAKAAPWDIVPTSKEGETAPQSPQISMQRGGSSAKLQTIEGLELTQFAKNLGEISAMAMTKDGFIYAADEKTGRIWSLSDRAQDGSLDIRRPLAQTFNAPSALAIIDETLYIADKQAVWALDIEAPDMPARHLTSLTNIEHQGGVSLIADEASLILGLSQNQNSLIVRINIETGHAAKITSLSKTPLHSLAKRKGAPLWAASGTSLGSAQSPEAAMTFAQQSIRAMALPGQYPTPENWPLTLKDTIIASQLGPKSMRLIAVPTEFGQTSDAPRVLVDGFLSHSGRSAWGAPGSLLMDKRGVFLADSHNGIIWRLSAKPKIEAPKETPPKTPSQTEIELTAQTSPSRPPLLIGSGIEGSQIGVGSELSSVSQIETGSTIVDDFEKAEADTKALKEQAKEKALKDRETEKAQRLKPRLKPIL